MTVRSTPMQTLACTDSGILPKETHTPIASTMDIVNARQCSRSVAMALGFSAADVTLIAAAISEVARNIVDHAKEGEITIQIVEKDGHHGMHIVASDRGPGIPDVAQAMKYGYSTRRGIGMGLPGAKWLVDEFDIQSVVGRGTTVTMTKWVPQESAHFHAA